MSEKRQDLQQSLPEQLKAILEASREATPASPDDFDGLEERLREVARIYPAPTEESYPGVPASALLRHVGDTDGGVYLYVESDQGGILRNGTAYEGTPTVLLSFEQEKEDPEQPEGNKIGSWSMGVSLFLEGDVVTVNATGMIKTGAGDGDIAQLPGCEPQTLYPASKALLAWIGDQVGAPYTLEPVPADARDQR